MTSLSFRTLNIFYVGLLLEGKMEEVLGKLKDGGKPVYAVTWICKPSCSIRASTRITLTRTFVGRRCGKSIIMVAGLSKADPDHKADYEANGKAAKEKMEDLQCGPRKR